MTLSEIINPWGAVSSLRRQANNLVVTNLALAHKARTLETNLSRRASELASAESVRDNYKARLERVLAKFDHDGDGKPGGSRKKAKAA